MRAELVSRSDDCVGESPRWDPRHRCLWWVDNERATVHRYDPDREATKSYGLPSNASSLACPASGAWLLATLPDGIYAISDEGPEPKLLVRLDPGDERCSFNDSGCDTAGRLWVGAGSESARGRGGLWSVSVSEPEPRRVLSGLSLPNGIGFSPDDRFMYLVDSLEHIVHRIPYDVDRGAIGDPEALCVTDESWGLPDGLAVDADGYVWVAFWGGGCVRRFTPEGVVAAEVRLPVELVAGCAFGGARLCDLYVTTAWYGLTAMQRAEQPLAGSLFRIETDASGVPVGACQIGSAGTETHMTQRGGSK